VKVFQICALYLVLSSLILDLRAQQEQRTKNKAPSTKHKSEI
jgi:hypothetical protein